MADPIADKLHRQASAAKGLLEALSGMDDDTRHDMTEGETDLFEAIDAAIDEMDECEVIADGCAERIEVYRARADKFKQRAQRIRGLIEQAMVVADIPTIKRPRATLTVKAVKAKPMVSDEASIPARFWKQPAPVLDKKAINEAISDGESIPGVTMDNGGTSLQIRRV